LLPTSGKVSATVGILGQGFTRTTAVSFNGTAAANFTVVSDTYITAVVPTGATTGLVTVTTPDATLQSNKKFRLTE
jgi:IPT/TIG domain